MTGEDAIREAVLNAPEVKPEIDPVDRELADSLRNDYGNGQRLIRRYGRDLIYVPDVGWHYWTGTHWSREEGPRQAHLLAHKTAIAIFREADALEADAPSGMTEEEAEEYEKRVSSLRRWAVTSGNAGKIAAMLAEAVPYLQRFIDDLDASPFLFNLLNGTLELGVEKGRHRFRPHRREDLITRVAAVSYDAHAGCPEWIEFMDAVQPEHRQGFLQRWAGYSMTGSQHDQIMVLLHGPGSNGKSVFVETIETLMGNYALRLPFESLLRDDRRTGGGPTPDLVNLPGRRWVVASEAEAGAEFSVSMIKRLTERTEMMARGLNKDFFVFTPQHHLTMMFNEAPKVRSSDDGTWRRLVLVPWEQRFVDERDLHLYPNARLKDYGLSDRLLEELPGILNWLLEGVRMYLTSGLAPPEDVRQATVEYRAANDPVGEFIRCALRAVDPKVEAFIQGRELYKAYQDWAKANAAPSWTETAFGRAAKAKLKHRMDRVSKYLDIEFDPEWMVEMRHVREDA